MIKKCICNPLCVNTPVFVQTLFSPRNITFPDNRKCEHVGVITLEKFDDFRKYKHFFLQICTISWTTLLTINYYTRLTEQFTFLFFFFYYSNSWRMGVSAYKITRALFPPGGPTPQTIESSITLKQWHITFFTTSYLCAFVLLFQY